MSVDWVVVKNSWSQKPIGALGFVGDEIAIVSAFYEDRDGNQDGKIGIGERIGSSIFTMKGKSVAEVASQAYADPSILMRDPSLGQIRGNLLVSFAAGLITDAIYVVYFNRAVGKLAGVASAGLGLNPIKTFVVKKGMEAAVKQAYRSGAH